MCQADVLWWALKKKVSRQLERRRERVFPRYKRVEEKNDSPGLKGVWTINTHTHARGFVSRKLSNLEAGSEMPKNDINIRSIAQSVSERLWRETDKKKFH